MNSVSSGEWIDVRGKRRGASGSIPRHCPGSGLSVAELRPPLNQAVRLPLIAPITVEQQPGHARPQRATQHGPPNDNLGRQRHGCPFWFPRRKINARQGSRFQVPGSLVPVLEGPRSRFRVPGSGFRVRGSGFRGPLEFAHKLRIAIGELRETQNHLETALTEKYLSQPGYDELFKLADRAIGAGLEEEL
jgi:23S rRNA-intervening sequence protein